MRTGVKTYFYIAVLALSCMAVQGQVKTYEVELVDSDSRNKHVWIEMGGVRKLFTFDTGCSSLSINQELLNELKKQNEVKISNDAQHVISDVMMSNGETRGAQILLIKRLKIGEYEFTNVVAQVSPSDRSDAPLLLGQSILERLRWYSIQGTTFRFEPYEEEFQQALYTADYHGNDDTYAKKISEQLLPYFREGRLSCFYTYKLFIALQLTGAYSDAIDVLHYISSHSANWYDRRNDLDLASVEAKLYYNLAVDDYNNGRYEQALDNNAQAKAIAQQIADTQARKKRLHDIGTLYRYIYLQTDPDKAQEYNQYK